MPRLNRRLRAAGLHLALSALVAALVSLLVFRVWYPSPYGAMAGGLSLFALLVGVDMVLGPALTAVVASPSKPIAELRRDLILIVLVQLSAFAYGLYTIALARPVHMAFEVDRLRIVAAADIDPSTLADAPEPYRSLPWTGPRLIAAVKPTDPGEQMRSVELGLAGIDLAMQPRRWRDYASESANAWRVARPVTVLQTKYPQAVTDVARLAAEARQPVESLRFLPLMSRRASWVALLAGPDARIVGYLPLEGFF